MTWTMGARKQPRRPPPTPFSFAHYHELAADETEARERGFEALGSPVEGPSVRQAEQEVEEAPAPPPPPKAQRYTPSARGGRKR